MLNTELITGLKTLQNYFRNIPILRRLHRPGIEIMPDKINKTIYIELSFKMLVFKDRSQ